MTIGMHELRQESQDAEVSHTRGTDLHTGHGPAVHVIRHRHTGRHAYLLGRFDHRAFN